MEEFFRAPIDGGVLPYSYRWRSSSVLPSPRIVSLRSSPKLLDPVNALLASSHLRGGIGEGGSAGEGEGLVVEKRRVDDDDADVDRRGGSLRTGEQGPGGGGCSAVQEGRRRGP